MSTRNHVFLTTNIKRCRHKILIKKNEKKIIKIKNGVKNQDVIYFCIYEFLQKKIKKQENKKKNKLVCYAFCK